MWKQVISDETTLIKGETLITAKRSMNVTKFALNFGNSPTPENPFTINCIAKYVINAKNRTPSTFLEVDSYAVVDDKLQCNSLEATYDSLEPGFSDFKNGTAETLTIHENKIYEKEGITKAIFQWSRPMDIEPKLTNESDLKLAVSWSIDGDIYYELTNGVTSWKRF